MPGIRATQKCRNCGDEGCRLDRCPHNIGPLGKSVMLKLLTKYRGEVHSLYSHLVMSPVIIDFQGPCKDAYVRNKKKIYNSYNHVRPAPAPIIVDLYEDDCPVCLEEGVQCRRPACNHSLCLDCYVDLKHRKPDATCPLCRGIMP